MPTYAYRCKNCEHQFETIQRMIDDPLTACPECKGVINRLLFPPAISFKGSGFHVNDYPDTISMVSGTSSKSMAAETSSEPDK
ncbi:MAG: zinc ribbon domain-containing protein [Armatimonadetes bacterium]|nr:zinc ribbon domain-containing protein [Armatimonadota bacterium]